MLAAVQRPVGFGGAEARRMSGGALQPRAGEWIGLDWTRRGAARVVDLNLNLFSRQNGRASALHGALSPRAARPIRAVQAGLYSGRDECGGGWAAGLHSLLAAVHIRSPRSPQSGQAPRPASASLGHRTGRRQAASLARTQQTNGELDILGAII